MDGIDIDHTIKVDKVLLLGSDLSTILGHPMVPLASITLTVEEITQDKKVIALKHRRRKNSRRKKGFRRDLTVLRVTSINVPEELKTTLHQL